MHKVHRMILIPVFGLKGVGHYIEGRFFATCCHSSSIVLMTTSAGEKMAPVLLRIVENHGAQNHQ